MLLPIPTAEEVVRFQKMYEEIYGTTMTASEALALLTRLVQFYYLTDGHRAYRQRAHQEMS